MCALLARGSSPGDIDVTAHVRAIDGVAEQRAPLLREWTAASAQVKATQRQPSET